MNSRNLHIYRYVRILEKVQGNFIDNDGMRAIRNKVKRRQVVKYIQVGICQSMTLHLPDEMTVAESIKMAEKYVAANIAIESQGSWKPLSEI